MLTRLPVQIVLTLLGVVLLVSCGGKSNEDVPLIFAAASLADVLIESAELYETQTGMRVDFSFGGSITLANQIATLGAPADGVFFVGEGPIDVIGRAGLIGGAGFPNLYTNSLVVVSQNDSPPLSSFDQISSEGGRIAIGDPALAPVGVYTRQALESAGIWDEILDKLIFAIDVRAAMAAVSTGNADYGIVYKTDAVTSGSLSIVYEIDAHYTQIQYMAVPLEGAEHMMSAKKFLDFVTIEDGPRSLFESAGFTVVGSPGRDTSGAGGDGRAAP